MGKFLFAFEPRIPQFYLLVTITINTDICQKRSKIIYGSKT